MQQKLYKIVGAALVLSLFMVTNIANATTVDDLKVAARTFGFAGVKKGPVQVAIIYNDASKAEADALHAALSSGLKAGKNTLKGNLVSIADLGGLGSAEVAIVTEGLGSDWDSIFAATSSAGILSFTSDKGCADAKKCIMAVRAKPSVEINVSQSAAAASGIKLKAALKLMVKMQD